MDSGCFNRTVPTTITTITTSNSSNDTVSGQVVTPIISVTAEGVTPGSEEDSEEVTITYSHVPYRLMAGDRYVCARWNTSVNCGGGGWTTKDCSLVITSEGNYQCKCLHQGTFTLLDVSQSSNIIVTPQTNNHCPDYRGGLHFRGEFALARKHIL